MQCCQARNLRAKNSFPAKTLAGAELARQGWRRACVPRAAAGDYHFMNLRAILATAMTALCAVMSSVSTGAIGQPGQTGTPTATEKPVGKRMDAKALFERGQAALQSGDLGRAEAAFREVLSVDPASAAAYANLGVIAM